MLKTTSTMTKQQTQRSVTRKTKVMTMDAINYINDLIQSGRKIGIFSCEDPYNTSFHRDLLQKTDYMLLKQIAGGKVEPATLDLGLHAKGINAWGVFAHYGIVEGHEVCSAIGALNNGHANYGPHFSAYIEALSKEFRYDPKIPLKENIERWVRHEYEKLLRLVPEKQKILKGVLQDDIIIFAGLVENSHDGKDYKARILFSNQNATRH